MTKSSSGSIDYKDNIVSFNYKGADFLKTADPLFVPSFKGEKYFKPSQVLFRKSSIVYDFNQGPVEKIKVFIVRHEAYFEVYAQADLRKNVTLTEWNLFGMRHRWAGFDQIAVANVNIKGRMTADVFDKLRLGDQMTRVTHKMGLGVPSWFFPLPTHYILGTYHDLLFLGLDDVYDFSEWTLGYEGSVINDWRLEYGSHVAVKKGQTITSPRWIGFFMNSDDPFAPWPIYTDILREKGKIRCDHRNRPSWWADLNYVTWGDQHVYANGQKTQTYRQTETNLSEETVRRWLNIIEKNKLPFKTITIDGYWCPQIGEWRADLERFPDMRKFVDELHHRGYKVIFWYCPFEAERAAPVFRQHPEYFVEETVRQELFLEKDIKVEVRPRYDYTHPKVREFIREDIRRMLSPEKGCYNGDGLKLDFYGSAPNAKRVKAFYNPGWGLGHRFILNAHAAIYTWAKEFKPDCRIDGENGNPFFSDYTDSLRAWDWCEQDYTVYNNRVKLASVICPGVPALYDEHIHFKNLYKYCLRSAVARPIFFNVEHFHGDMRKPTSDELKALSNILQVVANLNSRARDVQPENMDNGTIYDWKGKLIGKVSSDDTWLICEDKGMFTVILLNEDTVPITKGVVVEPKEFGISGKAFVMQSTVPPKGVKVLDKKH
ncbi:MAG: TIM-barrel domain-containing protein [Phycisphaerae bacterium]